MSMLQEDLLSSFQPQLTHQWQRKGVTQTTLGISQRQLSSVLCFVSCRPERWAVDEVAQEAAAAAAPQVQTCC